MRLASSVRRAAGALMALLAVQVSTAGQARAALVVEPAFIKLALGQERVSGRFVIRNTGDTEARYRARAIHFTLVGANAVRPVAADEHSLAEWIKFNPTEFVLPPKSSRMVRFSIIPRGKLQQQEYWGAIEFTPLEMSNVRQNYDNGTSLNLKVVSIVLVPIYGLVEGASCTGTLDTMEVSHEQDGWSVYGTVQNRGSAILRLTGTCQIVGAQGSVVEEVDMGPHMVLPGKSVRVKVRIGAALAKGPYRARLLVHSADDRFTIDLSREVEFTL